MLVSRVRAPRVGVVRRRSSCDDDCECPEQANPWAIAVGSAAIAVAAEVLVEWLKSRLLPEEDRHQIHVHVGSKSFDIAEDEEEPPPTPKRRSRS